MNVTKKILAMLFVASLFVFTGCTKDDDDVDEQMRVENLLVAKDKWTFEKASEANSTTTSTVWETALAGSYFIFNDDGTQILHKDGADTPGTWTLSTDGKTLTLVNNISITRTIVNITASNMTLEFTDGATKIWVYYN